LAEKSFLLAAAGFGEAEQKFIRSGAAEEREIKFFAVDGYGFLGRYGEIAGGEICDGVG
jgi:hypothetical protein